MASTHTLTGNIYDLTGATLGDTKNLRVNVVTNLPPKEALIDKTTNSIHLGGKVAAVNTATGEFTIDLIDTSATDLNVEAGTLQYEVRATYINAGGNPGQQRDSWASGWFGLTADVNLADVATDATPLAVASASEYALEAKAYRDETATISGLTGEDAAVALLVEDSGSATAGALSATFATPAPQRVVAFGDSITDDGYVISGVDVAYPHVGWWPWANAFLGWRFDLLADAGISGNSLLQMIARVDTDVLAHNPTWVWMNGGVNSINDGLSAATITGQFETLFTRFREAGIRVLCVTVNPSGFFDSAENAVRLEVNRWLRDYGTANKGVIIVDTAPYVQDTAGLGPATGMTRDTLHPSALGAQAMGYAVAKALAPITVPATPLTAGADTTNLLAGKGMFPGNDGSGLATDWPGPYAAGAAPTYAKIARTDGVLGEWQQVTVPSGANVVGIHTSAITTGWAVGDTVYAAVEFEVSGIDTAAPDNQVNTELVLNCLDGGGNIIAASHFGYDSSGPTGGSQTFPLPLSGVMRTPDITIPVGTNSIMPVLWSRGGGTRRWARCDVRKVT